MNYGTPTPQNGQTQGAQPSALYNLEGEGEEGGSGGSGHMSTCG